MTKRYIHKLQRPLYEIEIEYISIIMHSKYLTGCTMVMVLLPPFCLHSKTHFKTCFKKMLMH